MEELSYANFFLTMIEAFLPVSPLFFFNPLLFELLLIELFEPPLVSFMISNDAFISLHFNDTFEGEPGAGSAPATPTKKANERNKIKCF